MEHDPSDAPSVDASASEQQYSEAQDGDDLETPHVSPHDSPQFSPTPADGVDTTAKATAPIQKRRRVTRACDECRRKKIKCDGKQPCTHCTVYSYECTYDQPSNRRRNAAPQYIEALETQLKRAQAILKLVIPDADLNDPNLEVKLQQGRFTPSPPIAPINPINGMPGAVQAQDLSADAHLESMVKSTGQLDLDEQGNLEYHGHSSGLSFVRRMREQLGDMMGPEGHATPFVKSRPISQVFDSPRSSTESPWDPPAGTDLPTREVAYELCDNAINDAGALLRIVHWPTFKKQFDAVYDKLPEAWGNDENAFLPLLYATMSLGTLFAKDEGSDLDRKGYESAIEKGFKYFKASRSLMDIADCRDLRQLQAIVFMIMFLQSSAKLSTCYAYIGVALRSALRMGLHRSFPDNFNPIVAETRKRVFWVIRKMDTYVGALLGLPHSITDEDIDQEFPAEVDDEFITEEGILSMPEGRVSAMSAANAHTNLVAILAKIVQYVYPLKGSHLTVHGKTVKSYSVSYAKILEIERDLQAWQDKLPPGLKPGGDAPHIIIRVQQLLRMSYAHAQMMLYRPFLHYVSQTCHSRVVDKRSYACAAACVSVSRNIIHIAIEMKKRRLLIGAYWFTMYTTFFAILSLVFYALENPENNASQDVLRVAKEGKDTLEALAKRSMAADRCTATLAALFEQLPERFSRTRQNSISRKRRQGTSPHPLGGNVDTQSSEPNLSSEQGPEPRRANTYPQPSSQPAFAPNVSTQSLDPATYQFSPSHGFFDVPVGPSSSSATDTPSLSSGLSQHPDSYPMSPTNLTDPNFPLADLSAAMFPSADPFAYPDQNMPPAQSYDQIAKNLNNHFYGYSTVPGFQRGSIGTNDIHSPNAFLMVNGFLDHSPTQDSDVQLLGPTPFYLMQGNPALQQQSAQAQHQQPNGQMPTNDQSTFTGDTDAKPFDNQNHQGFPGQLNANGPSNLQVPNMNLDQLLGGEEWVGLDRTTSGMGTNINPSCATNEDMTLKPKQLPRQTGLGLNGEDNFSYEEVEPGGFGWAIESYPVVQ